MTDEKKAPKKSRYFVAEKFEVSTKRGQLKAGDEVQPKDFPGGQKTIDELVNKVKSLVKK